jgi:hypothetical protein
MARTTELSDAARILGGIQDCFLIHYPTGNWGFCGRIPHVLTQPRATWQNPNARASQVFATRDAAIAAATAHGITVRD